MMQRYKKLSSLALQRFQDANVLDLGAALAYFAVFSLIPLITVLIIIVGFFLDGHQIQISILNAMQGTIGQDATNFLSNSLERGVLNASTVPASIVGGFVLLFAVTTITNQMQVSLERIFCKDIKRIPFIKNIKKRITSFGIIILLAIFLMSFFVVSAGVSVFQAIFEPLLPFSYFYIPLIDLALNFLFIFGFAFLNFKFLPSTTYKNRSLVVGATATSVLFLIGKLILGLYLNFANPGSAYGAAGALLVLLLWIYYSSVILFLGACFSYAHENQSEIKEGNS